MSKVMNYVLALLGLPKDTDGDIDPTGLILLSHLSICVVITIWSKAVEGLHCFFKFSPAITHLVEG
jgi:hypothetical protein